MQNLTANRHYSKDAVYRLAYDADTMMVDTKSELLVISFEKDTKYNGIWTLNLSNLGFKCLTRGPWVIDENGTEMLPLNDQSYDRGKGLLPIKAAAKNIWVVKRQSFDEAPNLFITRDFKLYVPITQIAPQTKYNWLTAELVTWTQLDGSITQGVLYKPQDFDPNKRYPVIINHYQQMSHLLYQFPNAEYTDDGNVNIPWFVSRGYLILKPDIYYSYGELPKGTRNSILSAYSWLASKPYVDSSRIAITGHSYGGGQNNMLLIKTQVFAAAISGAGVSDDISSALAPSLSIGTFSEISRMGHDEQYKGGSIWAYPKRYLDNNVVLHADKIQTPLLIFQNKEDEAMPWPQAYELFTTLRRLGKKVWWLEYDHESHEVSDKNAEDFTKRVTQFLDHYLKDLPAPKWMVQGIPYRLRGIETGLDLSN